MSATGKIDDVEMTVVDQVIVTPVGRCASVFKI